MKYSNRTVVIAPFMLLFALTSVCARADAPDGPPRDPPSTSSSTQSQKQKGHPLVRRVVTDVKDYYTAPLHWDSENWAYFGGTLGAIAIAHQYDLQVRDHFTQGTAAIGGSTSDLQDALPAAALFLGTYLFSSEYGDKGGLTATWAMAEAAGLSTMTTFVLKYAAGRERPNATTDPNHWFSGGGSFPSMHAAAAFAIGTTFAESGSGGYRWLTRIIGYGIAGFTGYERLRHNAHWLSDVVAGAALGGSTGVFVLNRTYGTNWLSGFSVAPAYGGGVMLAYHTTFPR